MIATSLKMLICEETIVFIMSETGQIYFHITYEWYYTIMTFDFSHVFLPEEQTAHLYVLKYGHLSPAQLGRVDWTNELLNWITKYKLIVVAVTLVCKAAPCGDALTRQEIQG
jgi:hypothetical protein